MNTRRSKLLSRKRGWWLFAVFALLAFTLGTGTAFAEEGEETEGEDAPGGQSLESAAKRNNR